MLVGLTVSVAAGALRVSATVTVLVIPPPVIVMVPLLVPTVAVVESTLTVTVPLLDPVAGLTVSQLMASLTLQDTFEVIETDCAAGFAAPCVAVNDKLDEPRVNVGEGALTVNETGIDCGELVAPVPETVIDVVYVAAESPVTLAATAREPAPVPDAGDTDSHGTGLEAPQVNVPVPVLVMLTV